MVNTGWNGTGKRISLKNTRAIIDSILDGSIENAPMQTLPIFNFQIPTVLNNVDTDILDPRNTYENEVEWKDKATELSSLFIKNFVQYTDNEEGKSLVNAGPQL